MRRTGRTLQWLAAIPVVFAALVLLNHLTDDDGNQVTTSDAPTTTTTIPFEVDIGDLSDGEGGESGESEASELTELADGTSLEAGPGILPGAENNPPVVIPPPDGTFVAGEDRVRVTELRVDDPEARAGGDIGVLMVTPTAGIHMAIPPSVQTFAQQGWGWFPMVGPLDAINEALASLELEPTGDASELRVTVTVTDFGHGDDQRTRIGRGGFSYYQT